MPKFSVEDFIRKSNSIHSNRYNYFNYDRIKVAAKIKVECKEHGVFEVEPRFHLKGIGCPKCRNRICDLESFVRRAREIHGNIYDYSSFIYSGSFQKSIIICKKHGEFKQHPSNHIFNKRKCPKCSMESLREKDMKLGRLNFISSSSKIHNGFYDYSKVEYKGNHDRVIILCPVHGEFECIPSNHLRGHQCHFCSESKITKEIFIKKSIDIHGDKYDYSLVDLTDPKERKVKIKCGKHGIFTQNFSNHLQRNGCPKCSHRISSYEIEISEELKKLGLKIETSYKEFVEVKELDIISHDKKIAIEVNGLYWHSDSFKDKSFHLQKTLNLKKMGYRLIHIFEDDWLYKKDICRSLILNAFGLTNNSFFARKCEIKNVDFLTSKKFLEENHIQGNCISKIRLGLYYNGEIVSLMTFGKLRKNMGYSHSEGKYELLRFCNKKFSTVVGGASRLFKFFIKNYFPGTVISYCDKSRSEGNLYKILGFKYIGDTKPNYFYTRGMKRFNRFSFRKSILKKMGATESDTEAGFMKKMGYNRIYDCGSMKFQWEN